MHMASIVATMLTKTLRYIKGSVENDARSTDLLAAACTMGVAVCYAAPIGGQRHTRYMSTFVRMMAMMREF